MECIVTQEKELVFAGAVRKFRPETNGRKKSFRIDHPASNAAKSARIIYR
jgi:hypothetical protein